MSSRAEILEGVREVAQLHLGWTGRLLPTMRLLEDLELDSLKTLTLALEVENHFRVCLDQEAGIETVDDLVSAIQVHLDG